MKHSPLVDGGLRCRVPARPDGTTPHLGFVSLAPHLRSTLPSDAPSRERPCASLVLRLHAHLDRGLAPPSMTACTAHTARHEPRGVPRRLHAVVRLPPRNMRVAPTLRHCRSYNDGSELSFCRIRSCRVLPQEARLACRPVQGSNCAQQQVDLLDFQRKIRDRLPSQPQHRRLEHVGLRLKEPADLVCRTFNPPPANHPAIGSQYRVLRPD